MLTCVKNNAQHVSTKKIAKGKLEEKKARPEERKGRSLWRV